MNNRLIIEILCVDKKYILRIIRKSFWSATYLYADVEAPEYLTNIRNVTDLEKAMINTIRLVYETKMKLQWKEYDISMLRYTRYIIINRSYNIFASNINESTLINLLKTMNPNSTYINLNGLNNKSIVVDAVIDFKDEEAIAHAKIYSENGNRSASIHQKYIISDEYKCRDTKYLSDLVTNWFITDLRNDTLPGLIAAKIDKIDVSEVSDKVYIIEP